VAPEEVEAAILESKKQFKLDLGIAESFEQKLYEDQMQMLN
jgi:hypothetical protein